MIAFGGRVCGIAGAGQFRSSRDLGRASEGVTMSGLQNRTLAGVRFAAWAIILSTIGLAATARAAESPPTAIEASAIVAKARFPEPVIATGPTTPVEDHDLARALARYDRRDQVDDFSALTGFLERFPHSSWRISLLLDLGLEYEHYGYFSRALDAFTEAWREGKDATDAGQKPLVDRAVGELALLHARLGHEDRLRTLLVEIGDRPVANPGGELVQNARETLWVMENDPKHLYLCGPLALKFLLLENPATKPDQVAFVNRYRTSSKGVSLAELARLAGEARVSLGPVFRKPDQPVPVPSIVHWKLGHYAAILAREKGGYLVKDPVLGMHARWLPARAIEEEASGYFLAPGSETQKAGWREVDGKEAGQVFGAGPTTGPEPDDPGPPADPPPDDCGGMCGANIAELAVAVMLADTPVGYAPAIGPSAKVKISYNQREADQPAAFSYFNVSPNWTTNWLRFIQDDPNHFGASVMRYRADGSAWFESGFNSTTGAFAPEESDASVLVRTAANPVAYTRYLKDGSVEFYSQSDGSTSVPRNVFLTKLIDPQGNALTLKYTTSGGQVRLASLIDATGRITTFTYGSSSSPLLITKITDPFGRSATLTYDSSGQLSSITDVLGITSKFAYDSSGHVNSLTTPYGTTQFAYAGTGNSRFVDMVDPLGLHEREENLQPAPVPLSDPVTPNSMNVDNQYLNYRDSYHWDKHEYSQAACTVNGGCNYNDGRVRHFYHDAQNNNIEWNQVEAVKQPLETRIWYNYPGQAQNWTNGTYDEPNQVGRIVSGGASQLWQKTYNTAGNPTQVIDPVGRTTNLTYAANLIDLTLVQQVAASGLQQTTASYTYNGQHRPLTYTDAAGQATHYAYNTAGQVTKVTEPTGLVWSLAYDTFGRLTGITNPNGKSQASYTYDSFDRIATATDSEGYTLTYAYDAADRLTRITHPDGTALTYTYTNLDLASMTDRQGRTTKYAYDADRRLIGVTDPLGNVSRYTYWENGQLKSLTDPKGNVTSWTVDVEGRPTVKQYADGSKVIYGYDESGRLDSIRDAVGQIKQYSYTADDRLAAITYSYAVNPTPGAAFAYDPYFPRLVSMSDGTGSTNYAYAPVGSLGALKLQSETGPEGTISYAYDALGRMTRRTVSGAAETFEYDGLNRLINHTDPLGDFALTYLGQTGQLASRTQTAAGYKAQTAWSYLANVGDRHLASIANTGMRTFSFTTTPEDLITATVETGPNTWTYGYDNDNRLTSANYSTGLQYGGTLDADGNITALKQASATTSFTYNKLNELVSSATVSAVDYRYDANGNLLSDGKRSYLYDAANRLAGVLYAGTNASTAFAYDGLGRRVAITETSGSTSSTTNYQWCGSRICRQFAPASTLHRYYDEGEVLASGQLLYYGPDQLDSPRNFAIVDGATTTVEALDFDPFGNALTNPAAPVPDFRFSGMFYHGPSGLYLTQFRAYDPSIARWLSRDPLGEKFGDLGATAVAPGAEVFLSSNDPQQQLSVLSSNLYNYVDDNPITFVDPSGLGKLNMECFTKCIKYPGYLVGGVGSALSMVKCLSKGSWTCFIIATYVWFCAEMCSGVPDHGCYTYGSGGGPRGTGVPF
jgi:RHS repeat-associated protein